jgi:hypothetical protein
MSLKAAPIPKHVLKDKVFLTSENRTTLLTNVRMQQGIKARFQKNGIKQTEAAVLYYDAVHSRPKGIVPQIGDVVEYAKEAYTVAEVEHRKAFQSLHHWKAVLV